MRASSSAKTTTGLLLFVLLVVGGPYSYLIYNACRPSGVSDFFLDVGAFHTRDGC